MKGKNTGCNLNELLEIMAEIENGKFDYDGCDPERITEEIKEDISLLSSEQNDNQKTKGHDTRRHKTED